MIDAEALAEPPHLAHEREAVRLQAARGQRQQHVPGAQSRAVEHRVALDDADHEAGEVEVARPVEVGHVGGLAAEQRDAVLAAGGPDALDDLDAPRLRQVGRRQVVEEEERLGADGDHVVHVVVHDIAAGGLEAAQGGLQQHLRADAVGGGDEYRVAEAVAQVEEAGEAAEAAEHLGARRAPRDVGVAPDGRVGGVDIHAGIGVAKGPAALLGHR